MHFFFLQELKLLQQQSQEKDKSRQESERETDRQSRSGVDGYGQFGSDEWEEIWVLELVTLVSFPKQKRRRLFLFYRRQNERAVLYSRQSGTDRSRRKSRAQLDVKKSPSRAGLLPHHPACSTGSMPGTPHCCCMPPTLLLYNTALLLRLARFLPAHHTAAISAMFTTLQWNPLWQTLE